LKKELEKRKQGMTKSSKIQDEEKINHAKRVCRGNIYAREEHRRRDVALGLRYQEKIPKVVGVGSKKTRSDPLGWCDVVTL
jgi:hypothetical protein